MSEHYVTCGVCGKRGYPERARARAAVRRMRVEARQKGDDGDPRAHMLATYRGCTTGLWHVGHELEAVRGPNLNDGRLRFV